MEYTVESPLYEALMAITGKKPPVFILGKFSVTELDYKESTDLQQWCLDNARPHWSTGIGIIEAAEAIVTEAVGNCTIAERVLPV